MKTLKQAWDLVFLSYHRLFGQRPTMQYARMDERRRRCIIINSWLYLYRERQKWIAEVRIPNPLFARSYPCLRSKDRNKIVCEDLDHALVNILLNHAHLIAHQTIDEVREDLRCHHEGDGTMTEFFNPGLN